jgi:hypothetical protein
LLERHLEFRLHLLDVNGRRDLFGENVYALCPDLLEVIWAVSFPRLDLFFLGVESRPEVVLEVVLREVLVRDALCPVVVVESFVKLASEEERVVRRSLDLEDVSEVVLLRAALPRRERRRRCADQPAILRPLRIFYVCENRVVVGDESPPVSGETITGCSSGGRKTCESATHFQSLSAAIVALELFESRTP